MKRGSFKKRRHNRNRSRQPMRRKKPIAARSKTNSYRKRERDIPYMLAVKSLPCAAIVVPGHKCEGPTEADHAGPRGIGQKAHDSTVIPLCSLAHRQRHDFSGPFRGWDQAKMRAFLHGRIAQTQRYMRAHGFALPTADQLTAAPATLRPAHPLLAILREDGNVDVRYPDAARITEGKLP